MRFWSTLSRSVIVVGVLSTSLAQASSLSLPVQVPLAGMQRLANAQVPQTLAQLNETRQFLGGLVSAQVQGTVSRSGPVQLAPLPDGSGMQVSLPIQATFRAEPNGLGSWLAQDFGGAATVRLTIKPELTPQWEAQLRIRGDYVWTDPLKVKLTPDLTISVQSLVDGQVRAQLERLTSQLEQQVQSQLHLRQRAEMLWATVQQPWTLPIPEAAYARVRPQTLSVTPPTFSSEALKLSLGAQFELQAGLGQAPLLNPSALPTLRLGPAPQPGVELFLPVRLPYQTLSQLATSQAVQRTFPLPVPTSPTLRIAQVTVQPSSGGRISAAVRLSISGPLGLKVQATTEVSGLPTLDQSGRVLSLRAVTVRTRRQGLSSAILSWLADARAQAYLQQAARFDLGPKLDELRRQAQARLPYSPVPGVQLSGQVGTLKLGAFQVRPDVLIVTALSTGQLSAELRAEQLGQLFWPLSTARPPL